MGAFEGIRAADLNEVKKATTKEAQTMLDNAKVGAQKKLGDLVQAHEKRLEKLDNEMDATVYG